MKELLTAVLISAVVAVLVPIGISAAGTYELPPLPVAGARPATSFGPGPGTASGGATPAPRPPLPAGAVVVDLLDTLKMTVSAASAPAGSIVFRADNKGAIIHELAVFKTDLAEGAIPLAAGKADETKVQVLARTKNLPGKAIEDLTVTMQAGKYVLVCNIPAHYQSGMHVAFTVQ